VRLTEEQLAALDADSYKWGRALAIALIAEVRALRRVEWAAMRVGDVGDSFLTGDVVQRVRALRNSLSALDDLESDPKPVRPPSTSRPGGGVLRF
jgi:hypothetical protein